MIKYYDWLPQLESVKGIGSIPNELAMFTFSDVAHSGINFESLREPHKVDFFLFLQHISGSARMSIDMVEYNLSEPYNIIKLMPGQIVSIESMSDDFDAHVIILSQRFLENLLVYINGSVSMRPGIRFDVVEKVDRDEVQQITLFYKGLRNIVENDDNPYRIQVVQHVLMAIFYSSDRLRTIKDDTDVRTSADNISRAFLKMVKDNFRSERQLKYYADALCITPRYLSRVVKECTGSSAADWIERYVVLEARALLKSTDMTVQQISDYLNFPTQTFFGKYFKRRTGLSPKEYRRVG